MKKLTLVMMILVSLSGCIKKETASDTLSSTQAFANSQQDESIIIVDVRTVQEYNEGHIQSSLNLPLDSIKQVAKDQLPKMDQTVYVVCRSGNRSQQAQTILKGLGYSNVINIGSVFDWPETLVTTP